MAEELSPGVFVAEVSSAVRSITGVSTSTTGFVGLAAMGPIGVPTFLSSMVDFNRIFGGIIASSYLGYAVQAFFDNGGLRCYIVRTAHYSNIQDPTTLTAVKATYSLKGLAEGVDSGQNANGSLTAVAMGSGTSIQQGDTFVLTDVNAVSKTFEFDVANTGVTTGHVAVEMATASDSASLVKAAIILAVNNSGLAVLATSGGGQLVKLEQQGAGTAGNTTITQTLSNSATLTPVNFSGGTAKGLSPVASLRVDALTEGVWANALNVGTEKDQTTVATPQNSATAFYLDVVNATTLEAGDLLYIEGKGADDLRVTLTRVDTTLSPHRVYFPVVDLSTHPIPVGALVYTASEHKNKTALAADLVTGATFCDVVNAATFTTGTILSFMDVRFGSSSQPYAVGNVEIARVAGNRAYFTGAVTLTATIAAANSLVVSQEFNLTVYTDNVIGETYQFLSMNSNNSVDYAPARINQISKLVTVTDLAPAISKNGRTPFGLETGAGTDSYLTGGNDGTSGITDVDYVGSSGGRTGLYSLDIITDVPLISIPGGTSQTIHNGLITYAGGRKDTFAVLDAPQGQTAAQIVNYVKNVANFNTSYAALYWPWVKITDPLTGLLLTRPPSGLVLGRYSFTDNNRVPGVAKAPAGIADGQLQNILGLETTPSQGDRDLVYPAKINPLADFPGDGRCIWGCQTLSSDSNFRLIPVRRLFIYIRSSLIGSMRFVVFENNDNVLQAAVRRTIGSYLLGLWRRTMLKGDKPADAFFVNCDSSNNTPSIVNAGRLVCDVGVAPQRPTEFFEINLAIDQRALNAELAAAGL